MRKIVKGRYQILETLGKGGSGQVYKVWDIVLEKEWAMKELRISSDASDQEKNSEIQILKSLTGSCFPRIVDAFCEEERQYVVMDYISGITLEEYIQKQPLSELDILRIGVQIAEAVLSLHQSRKPLLYLDLKPSNIMIENGRIKIVDFGSVMTKGKKVRISGTFGYASPEQIQLSLGGSLLNEKSDIYSFGMVMFSMLVGECQSLPIISLKKKKGICISKYHPGISGFTERIIEKATRGNPAVRYSSMREVIFDMKRSIGILEKKKNAPIFQRKIKREGSLPFWQQEKSILCCGGSSLMYLEKGIFLFLLLSCLSIPPIQSYAKQKTDLEMVIRDALGRKVLVKQGEAYTLEHNLILEVPWENFSSNEYEITVECKEAKGEKQTFYLKCKMME